MRITDNSTVFRGVAKVDRPFVRISWGWLSLLATELVLAIVFLFVTIVSTRKLGAPVLKSSPLAPLLVSGLELQSHLGSIQNLDAARRHADVVQVRLEGGKLVLAS